MSDRLARMANRVARKVARGRPPELFAPVDGPAGPDLWDGLLDGPRESIIETFPDGTVLETYIDTPGSLRAALARSKVAIGPAEPEEPGGAPEAAEEPPAPPEEEPSRFASWGMPGHERD